MVKFLFIICLSSSFSFAQVQSLAEYNRSLLSQLVQKRTLNSKELKTLRIRLGTEMTSADDSSYKEGELLKLLEYASFSAYLSKNNDEEKQVRDMWARYLALPNSTGKKFEISYLKGISADSGDNPNTMIAVIDYYMRFIPKEQNKKSFFMPLIEGKCHFYTFLRKTAELQKCWGQYDEYSDKSATAKIVLKTAQIEYYYSVYPLKTEGDRVVKEILTDETLKPLYLIARGRRASARISNGDLKDIEAEMGRIKSDSAESSGYERLLLKLLMVQKKLDKALILFKGMNEKRLNLIKTLRYYELAAELFFRTNELPKSEFYLTKITELEGDQLNLIDPYLAKASIAALGKTYTNMDKIKIKFASLTKMTTDLKIEDSEYLSSIKLGQLIIAGPNINSAELGKALAEYKKYQYSNSLTLLIVEKLYSTILEKEKEIITK